MVRPVPGAEQEPHPAMVRQVMRKGGEVITSRLLRSDSHGPLEGDQDRVAEDGGDHASGDEEHRRQPVSLRPTQIDKQQHGSRPRAEHQQRGPPLGGSSPGLEHARRGFQSHVARQDAARRSGACSFGTSSVVGEVEVPPTPGARATSGASARSKPSTGPAGITEPGGWAELVSGPS